MAEEFFDYDENVPESALSGELGRLSATWLGWLRAGTDQGSGLASNDYGATSVSTYGTGPMPQRDGRSGGTVDEDGKADSVAGDTVPRLPAIGPGAAPRRGTHFERRYESSSKGTLAPRSTESTSPRSWAFMGDTMGGFQGDLQQRRFEDEWHTGRRWPGNGLSYPGSPDEALVFDQLAIALGEVDPRVLARESALRYVRASRISGKDDLGPTDIYAIFYFGLGLSLRPLNCSATPNVLGTYSRLLHEVYLDWTLLLHPPYGQAALDHNAWRRTLDSSPVARIVLAWCAATHLTENYDVPLVLGFCEGSAPISESGRRGVECGGLTLAPALGGTGDVLNRYRKTMIAFASLLAPQERLWQQISAFGLGIQMGNPEWRARVRALCSLEGSGGGWRQAEVTGHLAPGGRFWYPRDMDPAEQLITVLAERNSCPPSIVEWQLDGNPETHDWDYWSMRLLQDVPALARRYAAADRFLHPGSSRRGTGWGWSGFPTGESMAPSLRLSF